MDAATAPPGHGASPGLKLGHAHAPGQAKKALVAAAAEAGRDHPVLAARVAMKAIAIGADPASVFSALTTPPDGEPAAKIVNPVRDDATDPENSAAPDDPMQ